MHDHSPFFSAALWSTWDAYTPCIGECTFSLGNKTRTRTCLSNTTSFGAEGCPGNVYSQTVSCDHNWMSDDCTLGIAR